ncbi:S-adenosylmethionine:tRNA ribosyltransferase-isomerase [subsurface metagenome]
MARLKFKKTTGATIEVFCLTPYDPVDYQLSFSQTKSCMWTCMVGNLKKWKEELLELEFQKGDGKHLLTAEKIEPQGGYMIVRFIWDGDLSFGEVLDSLGIIPLPPYLNRDSEAIDRNRYQTVYSQIKGSVAAPTAGLHFTQNILTNLKKKIIIPQKITLHVGAGTFQPVKTKNALDHKMHSEMFTVTTKILNSLLNPGKYHVATGTTTLRTLESLYWLGVKSIEQKKICYTLDQWEYMYLPDHYEPDEAINCLLRFLNKESIESYTAETGIMIVPGYTFKLVQGLITNYHQPKSTLLLLVAAFVGDKWKEVYQFALDNNFRFLSYGDSSILWR